MSFESDRHTIPFLYLLDKSILFHGIRPGRGKQFCAVGCYSFSYKPTHGPMIFLSKFNHSTHFIEYTLCSGCSRDRIKQTFIELPALAEEKEQKQFTSANIYIHFQVLYRTIKILMSVPFSILQDLRI